MRLHTISSLMILVFSWVFLTLIQMQNISNLTLTVLMIVSPLIPPLPAGDLFTEAAEAAMAAMKGRLANKYYMKAEEAWALMEE